jgi:lipopolysaccharide biosynthesis regulator YciM
MDFVADIALRVQVPFSFDAERHPLKTPQTHEDTRDEPSIYQGRINAAKHAEDELVKQLEKALPKNAQLVEAVIEQVSEKNS